MTTYAQNVIRFSRAISVAEGSNPEWNNPGDLTFADGYPTCGFANSEHVLKFVNKDDGWAALYHQVWLMLTGKSKVYRLTDTIQEVGVKYAHDQGEWANNVAKELGVSITTTLGEII